MKKLTCIICLFVIYSSKTIAQRTDTIIKGVAVVFKYDTSIFPKDWLTAEINAVGKPIKPDEIERTKNIAVVALLKYPTPLLAANLKAVYFLKEMEFFNTGFGGTNSRDNLYLTNDGYSAGYTNDYIEQTFHHEFSSILFRNHVDFLDTAAWSTANIAGFIYNDPQAGVGAINNNQYF